MSETATAGITPQMLAAARAEGASGLFTMVAAVDPDAVKVSHNYVAREIARACQDTPDDEYGEAIHHVVDRAGHFMAALWDGDLAEALYRADGTNRPLLIRLLNDDVIMSALIEDRGSYESAERWFAPQRDRYGWDADLLKSE